MYLNAFSEKNNGCDHVLQIDFEDLRGRSVNSFSLNPAEAVSDSRVANKSKMYSYLIPEWKILLILSF